MTVTAFPPGGSAIYILQGTLASWPYFVNTASVQPPAGVSDPNLIDNSVKSGAPFQPVPPFKSVK